MPHYWPSYQNSEGYAKYDFGGSCFFELSADTQKIKPYLHSARFKLCTVFYKPFQF
jgi:hypothetical protein